MAIWRMKLRAGTRGDDMWPLCKEKKVAAITYNGIRNIDLRPYSRENHPPGWDQVGGGKGSVSHFAWDIRGGDTIFVGDSETHELVGMGYVKALSGEPAYRFDPNSQVIAPSGETWCHLIDVDWDEKFKTIRYKDRAGQITVLRLEQNEIEDYHRRSQVEEHRTLLPETEVQDLLRLEEAQYLRHSPAAMRLILRKHLTLSKQFKQWLGQKYDIQVTEEKSQIDATFESAGRRFLVEFKVAYDCNTKSAIREALGQILEYNHYPPRVSHDRWLLVLDTDPREQDLAFVKNLRERLYLPLSIGWLAGSEFQFDPPLDIR